MRVGHISVHACIRAHKMAWTMGPTGHDQYMISERIAATHSITPYKGVSIFEAKGDELSRCLQLRQAILNLEPYVDIWHVHNEPNWIFRQVHEVATKPIIWDIHDWTSLRKVEVPHPKELEEEQYAIENADGFSVCSKGYLKKIRELSKKPSQVVYSMVPERFFIRERPGHLPGICFEGGVKGKNDQRYNFPYRNWASFSHEAVKNFTEEQKFYFYTANDGEDFSDYEQKKVLFRAPEIYPEMLALMSQHDAGLVGTPFPVKDFEDSMPNKLFEYLAAGLPCIIINSPEALRFGLENQVGIGIQDASQVAEAMESLKDHRVSEDRWAFTMESQMPKLFSLYSEVLCNRSPRVIAQMT